MEAKTWQTFGKHTLRFAVRESPHGGPRPLLGSEEGLIEAQGTVSSGAEYFLNGSMSVLQALESPR